MSEGEMVMAWLKEIAREDNAAVATYWEVISIYYDHAKQVSDLAVGGWVDQAAYDQGYQPLMTKNWVIPSGLAPELATGALAFVGGFAKNQPEFEGWENE